MATEYGGSIRSLLLCHNYVCIRPQVTIESGKAHYRAHLRLSKAGVYDVRFRINNAETISALVRVLVRAAEASAAESLPCAFGEDVQGESLRWSTGSVIVLLLHARDRFGNPSEFGFCESGSDCSESAAGVADGRIVNASSEALRPAGIRLQLDEKTGADADTLPLFVLLDHLNGWFVHSQWRTGALLFRTS